MYHMCMDTTTRRHIVARKAKQQGEMTKTCTKTGFKVTGTLDEVAEFFYRDKTSKDGFATWCKAAEREYNGAYHKALKKAEAARKADIADDKKLKVFGTTMKPQRVVRGTYTNRKAKVAEVVAKPAHARKARTFAEATPEA